MRFSAIIFCLFNLVFIAKSNAQFKTVEQLMQLKPDGIGIQKVDTLVAVYLPMPFSQANFIHTYQLAKIPDASVVYAVHLVYTQFREVDSFNQPKLNYYRFQELQKIYPEVFNQTDVEWRVLEQRSAKTKEKAEKCFHGFVIYLKNSPPPEMIGKEIGTISTILDSYTDTMIWIPEKIDWKVKKRKEETGLYLPRSDKKRRDGVRYTSSGFGLRKPEYEVFYDSTIRKKSGGYWQKIGRFDTSTFTATKEFDFLTRRKWSPKMAVVTDVTGSMSPYSTQVMLWLKFNPTILKQGRFTFFNDGDASPDVFKRIGKTGGIYFASTGNFDSVYSVMTATMRKGLGGDIPENNLEAVIKTIEHWPDTDTILLIADNEATVKDMQLLDQVKKPVSVMVCSVGESINVDYINIARTTGGRIFVLNTEIENLKGISTGTRVVIGGKIYEWRKGTFVRAN